MSSALSVSRDAAAVRIRSDGTRARRFRKWLMAAIYLIVGCAGAVAFTLVLLPLVGWHTVVLATGSMSPDWPAGSVLVSRTVQANELAVGEVVTVARPDGLPVTHRIIAIEGGGEVLASRELTLQGDANQSPDPSPYLVDGAGLVMGGIPWGGQAIAAVRNPMVLGVMTVLISALVLRAWWPSGVKRRREKAH